MSGIITAMGSLELTDRQRRVVEAFRRRAADGAPPPTHRELCREFGWGSTGTARDHIRALVQKGILCAADRRSRGTYLAVSRREGRFLPLIGRIVAGHPITSHEHIEKEIFVSDEFAPRGKAFILRVTGDSMNGMGILDGDLVVVREARSANPGNVVAVTIDGESTLKLLQKADGKWVLVAANPKYAPIEISSPAVIHGVVTAVMRVLADGMTRAISWSQSRRERKG
jgi:repressor LexA